MLVVFLPCDCERTGEGEKKKSIGSQIGEILPITLPVSHSPHRITDTAAAAALVPAHPLQTHARWQEVHTDRQFALICCLFSCTVIVFRFLGLWHNIMIYFYHRSLFLSNRHQLSLNPLKSHNDVVHTEVYVFSLSAHAQPQQFSSISQPEQFWSSSISIWKDFQHQI